MDDEFLGDFNYVVCNTDSQKSIATTIAYSQDLTDGSSGKESHCTYVLQADSDSSRSHRADPPPAAAAAAVAVACYDAISLKNTSDPLAGAANNEMTFEASYALAERDPAGTGAASCLHAYSLLSQETFTQTSKTIFELAQTNYVKSNLNTHAIETQTSRVSIVENKTIQYRIEVSGSQPLFSRDEILASGENAPQGSRGRPGGSQTDSDGASSVTLRIVDDGPDGESSTELEPADKSSEENADTSKYDTEFTDSLEDECRAKHGDQGDGSDESVAKSADKDVEELYCNLEKSFHLRTFDRPPFDIPRYVALSPLTEETVAKAKSFKEVSPKDDTRTRHADNFSRNQKHNKANDINIRKLCVQDDDKEQWKLPPIEWQRRGGSPRRRRPYSPGPGVCEGAGAGPRVRALAAAAGRDGARACDWAAGEGASLATRPASSAGPHRLPAILSPPPPAPASRGDGAAPAPRAPRAPPPPEAISIHGQIRQLKMQAQAGNKRVLYGSSTTESRSSSPGSASERRGGGGAGADVTARGCEALCADVITRLREACSWSRMTFEQHVSRHERRDSCGAKWEAAVEVLEEIPLLFGGFWPALPEHRVADLLRLVSAQVESPRTRVARAACAALAALLSNTNYTKKPEFDEAVAGLLAKTGSMAAALRRAANLALDEVVAAVAPAPALAALCLFGAEHKSGLVRCAAARLLVVAAALAAGGRGLLRARPRSAAAARRLALRALAALLVDRSQDTRKYAERLYRLLRPLAGFEAFFLADVDTRTACRLMRKYDALLPPEPPPR